MNKRRLLLILIIGLVPLVAVGWFTSTELWEDITIAYVNSTDVQATDADTAPEAGTVKPPVTITSDFGPSPTYDIDIEEVRLQYKKIWEKVASLTDGEDFVFSPDSEYIAIGNQVFSTSDWTEIPESPVSSLDGTYLEFNATGDYLVVAQSNKFDIVDTSDWTIYDTVYPTYEIGDVGAGTGYVITTNGFGGEVFEIEGSDYAELDNGDSSCVPAATGGSGYVAFAEYASSEAFVSIYSEGTWGYREDVLSDQWDYVINDLESDNKNGYLILGGDDKQVEIYDSSDWVAPIHADTFSGTVSNVTVSGASSTTDRYYGTHSEVERLRIWNFNKEVVYQDEFTDYPLSLSPDGNYLAYNDGTTSTAVRAIGDSSSWTTLTEYTNTIAGSWASGPKQQLLGQYQLTEDNVGLGNDALARLQVKNVEHGNQNASLPDDTGAEGDNSWEDQWVTSLTTDTNKRPKLEASSLDLEAKTP